MFPYLDSKLLKKITQSRVSNQELYFDLMKYFERFLVFIKRPSSYKHPENSPSKI